MVKTIRTNSSSTLSCKIKVIRQLGLYLEHMDKHFFELESLASVQAHDTLYSILPMIDDLTSANDTTFAANLADRVMKCCNDIGLCHSRRATLLHSNIPLSLWALNVTLSLGMFFGIAIINTGSATFSFVLCLFECVLIGTATLSIADIDDPSDGFITLKKDPLDALMMVVQSILSDKKLLTEDIMLQSLKRTEKRATVGGAKILPLGSSELP